MRLCATPGLIVVSAVLLFTNSHSRAQNSAVSASRLKAAFLFNFAKFVEWPPEAFAERNSPFVIGVLDDDSFVDELEQTVVGKKIEDHPITVQAFRSTEESMKCHILFLNSEKRRLTEILQRLRGSPVLTVGETDRFIETGGMINFIAENNKIRFQINHDAAKAARLTVSSKLLNLAVRSPR